MKILKTAILSGTVLAMALSARAEGTSKVQGDYIESRSASVYAGPCHYSNEVVTAGNTATLAWRFREGSWNGVSLKGLSAVAVVSAQSNLAEDTAVRRSVLYLDSKANVEQTAALRALFAQKYGTTLGKVLATKAAAIEVDNDGLNYRVNVQGAAQLDVNRYPCRHCTQDAQIWYQPFVEAQNVIVGKTTHTVFQDKILDTMWDDKQEANSAFVGTFSL